MEPARRLQNTPSSVSVSDACSSLQPMSSAPSTPNTIDNVQTPSVNLLKDTTQLATSLDATSLEDIDQATHTTSLLEWRPTYSPEHPEDSMQTKLLEEFENTMDGRLQCPRSSVCSTTTPRDGGRVLSWRCGHVPQKLRMREKEESVPWWSRESLNVEEDLERTVQKLGLSPEGRWAVSPNDDLDPFTLKCIHDRMDPLEHQVEGLADTIQTARRQCANTLQFLQEAREKRDVTVNKLRNIPKDPHEWFVNVCRNETVVELRRTFPGDDPNGEVRESAKESLKLQFGINEDVMPIKVIIKELSTQDHADSDKRAANTCDYSPLSNTDMTQSGAKVKETITKDNSKCDEYGTNASGVSQISTSDRDRKGRSTYSSSDYTVKEKPCCHRNSTNEVCKARQDTSTESVKSRDVLNIMKMWSNMKSSSKTSLGGPETCTESMSDRCALERPMTCGTAKEIKYAEISQDPELFTYDTKKRNPHPMSSATRSLCSLSSFEEWCRRHQASSVSGESTLRDTSCMSIDFDSCLPSTTISGEYIRPCWEAHGMYSNADVNFSCQKAHRDERAASGKAIPEVTFTEGFAISAGTAEKAKSSVNVASGDTASDSRFVQEHRRASVTKAESHMIPRGTTSAESTRKSKHVQKHKRTSSTSANTCSFNLLAHTATVTVNCTGISTPKEVKCIASDPNINLQRIRTSKKATVTETSETRVCIKGHYQLLPSEAFLPFTVIVFRDQVAGDEQKLCGSYIRKMTTTDKNLRWKFSQVLINN